MDYMSNRGDDGLLRRWFDPEAGAGRIPSPLGDRSGIRRLASTNGFQRLAKPANCQLRIASPFVEPFSPRTLLVCTSAFTREQRLEVATCALRLDGGSEDRLVPDRRIRPVTGFQCIGDPARREFTGLRIFHTVLPVGPAGSGPLDFAPTRLWQHQPS
jgi:hypothetical protein